MTELVQENWLFLIIALVIGIAVAWWVFVASRRTRVELSRPDEDTPAKRNQALIDAAPVAPSAAMPPPAPAGLAGVGEAVQAAAEPAPGSGGDDLTRIKGLGPKLAEHLRGLGVTSYAQIAGWSDDAPRAAWTAGPGGPGASAGSRRHRRLRSEIRQALAGTFPARLLW